MTLRKDPPFRAEHIGSLLRPQALLDQRIKWMKGELPLSELRKHEDKHIADAVKLQEDVGLEAITDGEYRRGWWNHDFLGKIDGVDVELDEAEEAWIGNEYTIAALEAGCHAFVEKPLAASVAEAEQIAAKAKATGRKVVIGYILRHHPAWTQFIAEARKLGKPLVMRMNLNQQSSGDNWQTHRALMQTCSPIVDCGVHYVDIMCLMTGSRPVRVSGIGARLSDELPAGMVNYGQLQVTFADGSVGWYEAGWGPMMSETAFLLIRKILIRWTARCLV